MFRHRGGSGLGVAAGDRFVELAVLLLRAVDPGRIDGAQKEHRELYEVVARGDAKAAAAAMAEHRERSLAAWSDAQE